MRISLFSVTTNWISAENVFQAVGCKIKVAHPLLLWSGGQKGQVKITDVFTCIHIFFPVQSYRRSNQFKSILFPEPKITITFFYNLYIEEQPLSSLKKTLWVRHTKHELGVLFWKQAIWFPDSLLVFHAQLDPMGSLGSTGTRQPTLGVKFELCIVHSPQSQMLLWMHVVVTVRVKLKEAVCEGEKKKKIRLANPAKNWTLCPLCTHTQTHQESQYQQQIYSWESQAAGPASPRHQITLYGPVEGAWKQSCGSTHVPSSACALCTAPPLHSENTSRKQAGMSTCRLRLRLLRAFLPPKKMKE